MSGSYYVDSSNRGNVNELLDQAELYRDQALQYSNSAEASATDADTSEANALSSATNAASSASAASTSQANAASSASAAASSAANASAFSSSASSFATDAGVARDAAVVAKNDAQAAATNAAASATAAANSATQATNVLSSSLLKANNLSDLTNTTTARSNLGLGTAATQTITTSNADTTAGRVLKVGDFAIGASADTLAIPTTSTLDGTVDLNSITNPGWYYLLVGGVAGSRNPNHPDGQAPLVIGNGVTNYYWISVAKYSGNVIQIAYPYVSAADTTNVSIKFRVLGAGTWSSWKTLMMEQLTKALNEAPIVTLASASTVDIGAAAANTINISGTATITALGTIAAGAVRRLIFQGALTLTHNASSLILPSGASIVTAAGDSAEFVSLGSGNWRCASYNRASGKSLVNDIDTRQLCTAWVNFNGTSTVAIRDSYNVSSITDNGAGDYTVNFASAMLNTNYSVVIGATVGVAGNFMVPGIKSASLGGASVGKTTGGVSVVSVTSSAVDNADFNVVIFGGK